MGSKEEVSLPLIHNHLLMPLKDLRRGDCCGSYESLTDGFYCKICDFFVHEKCSESSEFIQHPSHPGHTLKLVCLSSDNKWCDACGNINKGCLSYYCKICAFDMDLCCAKYQPPHVVDVSEAHNHKLTLVVKEKNEFQCSASTCIQKAGDGVSYKCHECDLDFHLACVWNPRDESDPYEPSASEVKHSNHSLHSLKLLTASSIPKYSDGKCRLCGREVDEFCYHCSFCNFTVDMRCVLNPPPKYLTELKAHEHQLTLLPRLRSFVCNACGLSGDRSPYVCLQCDFFIHQECIGLPRLININRHDHRVCRVTVLGVMDSFCGVCRQEVDWTCGGYSCQMCPSYVVHSKCATRNDVWNGEELDGIPEETEDTEDTKPYEISDEIIIKHFSHEEHYLKFHVGGSRYEGNKWCKVCAHPISLQSFYGCMDCDFLLHQYCAELPKRRRHVLQRQSGRLTLVTNEGSYFQCDVCYRISNGFIYSSEEMTIDVICGSITEPFIHPSHPYHPLYYIPNEESGVCNGCEEESSRVLRCDENDCGFILDFKCATLPQVVKLSDEDHPFLLCYGKKASGRNWCYICEVEINVEKWFYTCKDNWATLHTECVLGDLARIIPRNKIEFEGRSYEVVLNESSNRPCCRRCKLRCFRPTILKLLGTSNIYFCSWLCAQSQVL